MRILQCHVSKSVSDFPWHQIYALDDYRSEEEPAVFFGMYRYEDLKLLLAHKAARMVFWTGQDVLQDKWKMDPRAFEFPNVTAHPKVAEYLRARGYACELVAPSSFLNDFWPQVLGTKVYAYCPNNMPEYHGLAVLNELRRGGLDITIGDGTIRQEEWRTKRDTYYAEICIGLCLSSFAGGGTSIIEMGLRGVRVVTNVFVLPHTLRWIDNGDVEQSAQHIAGLIASERTRAGKVDKRVASTVYRALDHDFNWLNI